MEHGPVVVAARRERHEVAGRDGRQVGLDLERHRTLVGVVVTVRVWPAGSAGGWLVGHEPCRPPTDGARARLELGWPPRRSRRGPGPEEQEADHEHDQHDRPGGQPRQPGDAAVHRLPVTGFVLPARV